MTTDDPEQHEEKILIYVDPDIADLIPGYLEKRREDIAALLTALEHGDFETVRILGHSMKGSGGGYGFDAISEIGAGLEQAAKSKHFQEIREQVSALSSYLDRVVVSHD